MVLRQLPPVRATSPHRPLHPPQPARRRWLARVALPCLLGPPLGAMLAPGARAAAYPLTTEAMRQARDTEMAVYYRYTDWGRHAQAEGYAGIAYLFAAFASAEFIHAGNFGRVLVRLHAEAPPVQRPVVAITSTREHLIAAANGEAYSVERFYPGLLERIRPEGHADALQVVQWAWNTELQHRDKIRQLQRYSPNFFDLVARTIDQKTDRYFVCQICGNTVNRVPNGSCGVCANPSRNFRLIDPPTG